MIRHPGTFVVFEGLDGAGTTTQLRMLQQALTKRARPHCITAQPSKGPIGQLIRQGLRGDTMNVSPHALMLLFAADRHHLFDTVVEPSLAQGIPVICDRHVLSSLVYQQAAGVPRADIVHANEALYPPDLYLYFNVPPAIAAQRRMQRGGAQDRYENEAFQQQVALLYQQELALLSAQGQPCATIEAHEDPDRVHTQVLQTLDARLGW